jgi:HTH-type transcriptional regulator / antitoxin HigA
MSGRPGRPGVTRRYHALIRRLPLRPIASDGELRLASALIDELTARDLAPDEADYLDVLADLVERYEDAHHPIPETRGPDVLRHLLESSRMTQADAALAAGISESTISRYLGKKVRMRPDGLRRLAGVFRVDVSVFEG